MALDSLIIFDFYFNFPYFSYLYLGFLFCISCNAVNAAAFAYAAF